MTAHTTSTAQFGSGTAGEYRAEIATHLPVDDRPLDGRYRYVPPPTMSDTKMTLTVRARDGAEFTMNAGRLDPYQCLVEWKAGSRNTMVLASLIDDANNARALEHHLLAVLDAYENGVRGHVFDTARRQARSLLDRIKADRDRRRPKPDPNEKITLTRADIEGLLDAGYGPGRTPDRVVIARERARRALHKEPA